MVPFQSDLSDWQYKAMWIKLLFRTIKVCQNAYRSTRHTFELDWTCLGWVFRSNVTADSGRT